VENPEGSVREGWRGGQLDSTRKRPENFGGIGSGEEEKGFRRRGAGKYENGVPEREFCRGLSITP